MHRAFEGISEDAARVFLAYDWPGNVRELKNVIERIMALNQSEEILLEHLPLEIKPQLKPPAPDILKKAAIEEKFVSLSELEKRYIRIVLKHTGGNKSQAAKILGIHFTSLLRKLKAVERTTKQK